MRSRLAHTTALVLGAAGATGITACGDRPAPLEPTAVSTPPVTPATTASGADAAVTAVTVTLSRWEIAALTVDDVRTRLVPALGPVATGGAVGGTVTGLASAIGVADVAAIISLLDAARQALDRYLATEGPSRRADVDAVRLGLNAVAAAVTTKDGGGKWK